MTVVLSLQAERCFPLEGLLISRQQRGNQLPNYFKRFGIHNKRVALITSVFPKYSVMFMCLHLIFPYIEKNYTIFDT